MKTPIISFVIVSFWVAAPLSAQQSIDPVVPWQSARCPPRCSNQVWANLNSKIYHCPADRYYGKTKAGRYMSEAEAKSSGFRPKGGKPCSP
jgi:hypothetical protein